jgi:hypothetical protein
VLAVDGGVPGKLGVGIVREDVVTKIDPAEGAVVVSPVAA